MEASNTLSRALGLLRRAGIRISGGNLERLSLTLPDSTVREVRIYSGPAARLTATKTGPFPVMVVTDRAAKGTAESAAAGAFDLIAVESELVIIGGQTYLEAEPVKPERTGRRHAWGRWALMRALILARSPVMQKQLAEAAGISQPAVTKHLKALGDSVLKVPGGWIAADRGDLIRQWLDAYLTDNGASTYWYSLQSPMDQARSAAQYATEMDAHPLISGSAAADFYAPWALPTRFRVYLKSAVDFTDAGFVPASPDEATMTATIPEDQTLWTDPSGERQDLLKSTGLPLADPLTAMADVLREGNPDSEEAAKVIANRIEADRSLWQR